MFLQPANAATLAEQHRQYLTAQARSQRVARTIRTRRFRHGRLAAVLAAVCGLVAFGTTPAFAGVHPEDGGIGGAPGSLTPVQIHAAVTGGMPGWQVGMIAIGAALAAAVLAVSAYRARASRQREMAGVA
jgi:hypothetical protein